MPKIDLIHNSKNKLLEFRCVDECSQCCIEREYYPSKKFGKIGVLLLPEEKEKIEYLGRQNGVKIKILPRIGISNDEKTQPTKILAYQMMGLEENGNTCPFLDKQSVEKNLLMEDFHVRFTMKDRLHV